MFWLSGTSLIVMLRIIMYGHPCVKYKVGPFHSFTAILLFYKWYCYIHMKSILFDTRILSQLVNLKKNVICIYKQSNANDPFCHFPPLEVASGGQTLRPKKKWWARKKRLPWRLVVLLRQPRVTIVEKYYITRWKTRIWAPGGEASTRNQTRIGNRNAYLETSR